MGAFDDDGQYATCQRYREAEKIEQAKVDDLQRRILPNLESELFGLNGEMQIANNTLDRIVSGLRDIAVNGIACGRSISTRNLPDIAKDCTRLGPGPINLANQEANQKQKIMDLERQIRLKEGDIQIAEDDLRSWKNQRAETANYIREKC